jgi:tetratricopeptide (TPR) repeat protein
MVALVSLVVPTPARAKEDPDTEVARRHFQIGRAAYDAGDYQQALESFERANRIKPAAAFDFNIGRCFDRLERYPEAIASYQRFVSSIPTPPDADEVRARIAVLKERIASAPSPTRRETPSTGDTLAPMPSTLQLTAEPEAPKVDPEAERRRKNRRTAAIVVSVIAGALVIGGAVAAGLLIRTTTEPNSMSTLGTFPGTN